MNTPATNRLMVARDLASKKPYPAGKPDYTGPVSSGGKKLPGGQGVRHEAQTAARVA